MNKLTPYLSLTYYNKKNNIFGYLVIDRLIDGFAAGGLRVLKGTNLAVLGELALNMTQKQLAVGIKVGGAKAGLDMDPNAPFKTEVIKDFLLAIKPFILNNYSVGGDMNTTLRELETIAQEIGIPSLKISVGRNKGLNDEEFLRRYSLFETKINNKSINQLRAPMGGFASTKALIAHLGLTQGNTKVSIQGAGNIGEPMAQLLDVIGVKVIAWADEKVCLYNENGLNIKKIQNEKNNNLLPDITEAIKLPSEEIFNIKTDIIILAAISNAISKIQAQKLDCKGIVESANLAINYDVESDLHDRNILVVPDLIASVGGSIAVQALYEINPRNGEDILSFVEKKSYMLTQDLLKQSMDTKKSPRYILTNIMTK